MGASCREWTGRISLFAVPTLSKPSNYHRDVDVVFEPSDQIPVKWALPRIARHLTSIGVFGPGFGAVVPKWGGGAEISQVACRAGAVGGGVYVLGTRIKGLETVTEDSEQLSKVQLSNGETVRTRHLIGGVRNQELANPKVVSKITGVVSSPLTPLFKSSVEGSPLAAVSVVVVPSNSLPESIAQPHPVYIMVHSSETGECPNGQCECLPFLVPSVHYMMIQLMNTYLHCLNFIEDNIPLTV